jgi:hypothetical protein
VPFEKVQPLLDSQHLGKELGLRGWLVTGVHRYHVVVNPKYASAGYPIAVTLSDSQADQVSAYLSVPFGSQ